MAGQCVRIFQLLRNEGVIQRFGKIRVFSALFVNLLRYPIQYANIKIAAFFSHFVATSRVVVPCC